MTPFQEYPKRMSHPMHEAARYHQLPGKGTGLFAPDTVCDAPERFPDVTVTTREQEAQYASKGYRPNNVADPKAYEEALLGAASVQSPVFQAFPKWKYHAIEMPVIVNDEGEERALGAEWKDSPVLATDDDLPDAPPAAAAAREEPAADVKPAKKKAKKKAKTKAKAAKPGKAAAAPPGPA